MKLTYPFTTQETPDLAQAGGKALSLIFMTQHGLPVPPGFVLTVAFFEPWLAAIQQSPAWARVLADYPENLKQNIAAVEAQCQLLELGQVQRETLTHALEALEGSGGPLLLAVRSSSPEEDLEELSFAGGYETTLGVKEETLEDALRHSFASCFDERVFVYKQEHGLAIDRPRIAIIVQQQVAAETAGVAFSLNPLNNCYDEAVINANFGLGESVVSGQVSPDTFVVDKTARTILERRVGGKETSVWLDADGGTYEEPAASPSQLCLSDAQVLELADLVAQVEAHYGKPTDVEWAFASGMLHMLQARPITAYVPLPEEMLTAPGEPKHIYFDLTLVKWGMHAPLSVIGMDYIAIANSAMLKITLGQNVDPDVARTVRPTYGRRVYVDASLSLRMQGRKRLIDSFQAIDAGTAAIFQSIDVAEYTATKVPSAMRGSVLRLIFQNVGTLVQGLRALKDPTVCRQRYLEADAQGRQDLARQLAEGERLSMRAFAESTMETMIAYTNAFFPTLIASEIARAGLKRLFKNDPPEIRDQLQYLERALPDNVTIEMGLAMHHLAGYEDIRICPSGEAFAAGIEKRAFSPEFLEAWDTFIETYGFRAPMEMDPATPRFYEQPARLFAQLRTIAENADSEHDPQVIYDRAKAQRENAYHTLLQVAQDKGKRKAKTFQQHYEVLMTLGGHRETPKYFFAMLADLFRRRVLATGRSLVGAGRLEWAEQVFDLTIDELDQGLANPTLDLQALAEGNARRLAKFRRVREFPRVIDSRGKILRPPRKEAGPGELAGEPISAGVVHGPVKILHEPDEKPVLPGDILVTRATDPGWTPLFLNASGIVLEVGGMLQHGALVAREYGKPCVAGIENATSILRDGQMVELDGTGGVIRVQ